MRIRSLSQALLAFTVGALLVLGQKQPQIKSQKEQEAVMALFQAQTPDARLKAGQDLITRFADTEFKAIALTIMAQSAQDKKDHTNAIIYAEQAMAADPNAYQATLVQARGYAETTKKFDFDREEKLKKAEAAANKAIEMLKTAPKPNPQLTDEQWNSAKQDLEADARETLGMAMMVRENWDGAAKELAIAAPMSSNPNVSARLGQAYLNAKKYDEAVATFQKLAASSDPAVANFGKQRLADAEKMKAASTGTAKPATAPASTPKPQ